LFALRSVMSKTTSHLATTPSRTRSHRTTATNRWNKARRLPPYLEALEERIVLDTKPFPTPLSDLLPRGGLILSRGVTDRLDSAIDSDSWTLPLNASQRFAVVLRPLDPSLQARLTLINPSGGEVGNVSASAPGKPVVFQVGLPPSSGTYQI